jgi:hypothetical protein
VAPALALGPLGRARQPVRQEIVTANHCDLLPGGDAYAQLWMAILRQALDDATYHRHSKTGSSEAVANRADARKWLRAEITSVGSMQWICDLIGIPAERVRSEFEERLLGNTGKRRRGPYPRKRT